MHNFISRVVRDESGATAVEYGLILALVFLAMIGAIRTFGESAINMWNNVSTTIANAGA